MTAAPTTAPLEPTRHAERIVRLVFGWLAAIAAAVLLLVAIAFLAVATQRDGDGFFTSSTERFSTSSYALTYEQLDVDHVAETPDWIADRLGPLRIKATSVNGALLFVGVGRESDVDRYLAGVSHDEITEVQFEPFRTEVQPVAGAVLPGPPGHESIWATSAFGQSPSVSWEPADGDWALVLMSAEGERSVAADVQLGVEAGWVLPAGLALAGLGIVVGICAAALFTASKR
jgi:hypothetical protein